MQSGQMNVSPLGYTANGTYKFLPTNPRRTEQLLRYFKATLQLAGIGQFDAGVS